MKTVLLMVLAGLTGCSLFHSHKPPAPVSTQLIVTGSPPGSSVYLDGAAAGDPIEAASPTRVLEVTAGTHLVEVRTRDAVVYRESTYVDAGDKRVITVLSGLNRE